MLLFAAVTENIGPDFMPIVVADKTSGWRRMAVCPQGGNHMATS